ncbi:hypothetical protein CPB83DRAFT_322884 [Crepidotus variabilis]|uniref:T6SS Phospholipase effector Tle1-like catalytic domain-containing protein n=1 Tax=Crepidotus variabilis TaxID=179855 RepID=A0A9P6JVP7_9AGAR|nr:hypothetical protein CPB83DRAFT_322884 [Crepidotus variabilis]
MAETFADDIYQKRLIVLCDGTGQASDTGGNHVPTNVTRFARALAPSFRYVDSGDADGNLAHPEEGRWKEVPQIVLYQSGVGTEDSLGTGGAWAGIVGAGVDEHILQAYTFFVNNYEKGDYLYIFGFSRGAFTARALASFICNAGLLKREKIQFLPILYKEYKDRLKPRTDKKTFSELLEERKEDFATHDEVLIALLGLWDTVGSLGMPQTWVSTTRGLVTGSPGRHESPGHHDTSFPVASSKENWKGHIWKAYQALALDECRTSFQPTLLYAEKEALENAAVGHGTEFQQVWFPGVHTDVGGGYSRAPGDISDIALTWMIDMCSFQLQFRDQDALLRELRVPSSEGLDPSHPDKPPPAQTPWGLSKEHDEYHTAKFVGAGWVTRTPGQYFTNMKDEVEIVTNEAIHESVRYRMTNLKPKWEPPALAGFKLVKDKDGYYSWEKEVTTKKGKKTIPLREERSGELSSRLIGPEVQAELNGETINKNLKVNVILVEEKGYTSTLASATVNALASPFKKIASFF